MQLYWQALDYITTQPATRGIEFWAVICHNCGVCYIYKHILCYFALAETLFMIAHHFMPIMLILLPHLVDNFMDETSQLQGS